MEKRRMVPSEGRRGRRALSLLSGLVLLLALGLSASHSHHGQAGSSSHCAVCQIQGLHLEQGSDLPTLPSPPLRLESPTPAAPETTRPAPIPTPTLPRAPPIVA